MLFDDELAERGLYAQTGLLTALAFSVLLTLFAAACRTPLSFFAVAWSSSRNRNKPGALATSDSLARSSFSLPTHSILSSPSHYCPAVLQYLQYFRLSAYPISAVNIASGTGCHGAEKTKARLQH